MVSHPRVKFLGAIYHVTCHMGGGFEVAMRWRNGRLAGATLKSLCGNPCNVAAAARIKVSVREKRVKVAADGNRYRFETCKNGLYSLRFGKELKQVQEHC